jgi:hypothetical protein
MENRALFSIAADVLLVTHALFVAFVVLGLLLILAGKLLSWRWVRNPWFRVVHLLAIGIVVLQSWLGAACPLTTWEMNLREQAGKGVYGESFIAHWLGKILYYHAPPWVFAVCYGAFFVLVLASWLLVRPRGFGRRHR